MSFMNLNPLNKKILKYNKLKKMIICEVQGTMVALNSVLISFALKLFFSIYWHFSLIIQHTPSY